MSRKEAGLADISDDVSLTGLHHKSLPRAESRTPSPHSCGRRSRRQLVHVVQVCLWPHVLEPIRALAVLPRTPTHRWTAQSGNWSSTAVQYSNAIDFDRASLPPNAQIRAQTRLGDLHAPSSQRGGSGVRGSPLASPQVSGRNGATHDRRARYVVTGAGQPSRSHTAD